MAAASLWDLLFWLFRMPCMFQLLTGLYCPGCGGTRAVRYLLTGHLFLSFQYHPLVPYAAFLAVVLSVDAAWAYRHGKRRRLAGRERIFVYAGLGIILINWIIKNYMLLARGVDLLAVPL